FDGSSTVMPMMWVATVVPTTMRARSAPMMVSVRRALRHSGGLNAGTPSLIASTPVSALEPDANACRTIRMDSMAIGLITTGGYAGPAACAHAAPAHCPVAILKNAHASIVNIADMKKKVGAAKMEPDPRRPRRFP